MRFRFTRAVELRIVLPLAIFILTYFVIAIGKFPWLQLDRTGAALAGALAMVLSGTISQRTAEDAVDFRTLILLLGMMIIVANLRLSGAFELVAGTLLKRARSGFGLLAMTVVASGVLAAFFINDVVCLALTPPLIEICRAMEIDAAPFLLALATASNIGSVATITGNPQNMIVAGFANLDYASFAARLAPLAIAGLAVDYAIIAFVYRHRLRHFRKPEGAQVPSPPADKRWHLAKSTFVAVVVLVLFCLGYPTHLVALGGGAALLFTRRIRPDQVYGLVDWTLLVMFSGLFIVVAGAETTGFQNYFIRLVGIDRLGNTAVLALVMAALSNLVSNVPAVLLFRPIYPMLHRGPQAALVVAASSTLAGNLTLVGSIANLIVVEQARRENVTISFGEYLRVGLPITILTLALAIAWFSLV